MQARQGQRGKAGRQAFAHAAELLAFVGHQPASDYATRTKARRLLEEVSAQLTPEVLAEAEARGRAGTLEEIAAAAQGRI